MPRALTQKQRIQRGQEGAIRRYGDLTHDELYERARAGKINPHVAAFLLSRAKVTAPTGAHSTSETGTDGCEARPEWRGHAAGNGLRVKH